MVNFVEMVPAWPPVRRSVAPSARVVETGCANRMRAAASHALKGIVARMENVPLTRVRIQFAPMVRSV